MQKILSVILLLFAINCSYAQQQTETINMVEVSPEKTEQIKQFFAIYFDESKHLNIDAILEKTHPSLFELFPKQAMKNELENSFNNPSFQIAFNAMSLNKIDKAFDFQGIDYYIVSYYSEMKITFNKEIDQTDGQFNDYMKRLLPIFQSQFEGQIVEFVNNSFIVKGNKKIIVINDPLLLGFKMLELKPELKVFYTKMLPEAAVEEIFKL